MRFLTRTFDFATPWGWAISAVFLVAFLGLLVFSLQGVGFRWDPFNLAERRVIRAEGQAARAIQDSSARRIETAGAQDTTRLVEAATAATAAVDQAAAHHTHQARSAPDANVPLDSARAGRISDGDRQLCALRPAVCAGRAAAP